MYSAKGNCDSENEQKNLLELNSRLEIFLIEISDKITKCRNLYQRRFNSSPKPLSTNGSDILPKEEEISTGLMQSSKFGGVEYSATGRLCLLGE